ncbi:MULTISPECIES: FG-GAP-like repeat-containing protein [Spirulina sp. CCY15215]|uniref:FG-GAP-like repeat-containing protein n=1 Tax=Spirulina sp. CCY15215 TaxID=2767591 RepID=UPI0019516FB1|nr:FG-GAP-like repeat-containing protein [Spirulina major]
MTQFELQLKSSNPFDPSTPLQVDRILTSPVIVDFDGDGNLDAFVGTTQGDILYIKGLAGKQFDNQNSQVNPFGLQKLKDIGTKPANITSAFGNLTTPAVVDIDGDDDLDLFVGEYDGFVYFFENKGDNTFEAPVENPFGITHSRPSSFYYAAPAFIDSDGDGFVETAYVGGYNTGGNLENFLKVYTRDLGETNFQLLSGNDYPFQNVNVPTANPQGTRITPTLADFDGDGDFDVFLGQTEIASGKNSIRYFANEGSNTTPIFVEQNGDDNPFNTVNQQHSNQLEQVKLDLVDFLGNDILEAFTGSRSENGIRYFVLNEPPPQLPSNPQTQYKLEPDKQTPLLIEDKALLAPVLVDFDQDGKLDLVVGTNDKELVYYRNAGDKTFEDGQTLDLDLASVADGLIKPSIVDIDNDGDLDIIVGDKNGDIHFFQSNGDDTFATPESNPFGLTKVAAYASPTFIDEENDGKIDWAFIGGESSESGIENYIKVFKNNGTPSEPSFSEVNFVDHPFKSADVIVPTDATVRIVPEFIDFDKDGDLDAFLGQTVINSSGEGESEIRYFENIGAIGTPKFFERTGNENPFRNVNQSKAELLKFAYPTLGDFLENGENGKLEAFSGSQSADTENGLRYLIVPQSEPDTKPETAPKSNFDPDKLILEGGTIFKMGKVKNGGRVKFKLANINIEKISEITISFLDSSNKVSFSEVLFSTLPPGFQPRGFAFGRQKLFLNVQPNQRFKINIQSLDRTIVSQEASIIELNSGQFRLNFASGLTIEIEQSLENPPIGVGNLQKPGLEILDLEGLSGLQSATFTLTREARYTNEVYFYRINDTNGTIDGLAPGQEGYAAAAIRNRIDNIALRVGNQSENTENGSFNGGFLYAPIIIANGSAENFLNQNPKNLAGQDIQAYFVFGEANSDRADHIRLLGSNTFGFEDLPNGGDLDYNDIIVEVNFA